MAAILNDCRGHDILTLPYLWGEQPAKQATWHWGCFNLTSVPISLKEV